MNAVTNKDEASGRSIVQRDKDRIVDTRLEDNGISRAWSGVEGGVHNGHGAEDGAHKVEDGL